MRRAIVTGARATLPRAADVMFERQVSMVRAEYRDMPGLGLTVTQAARLFGLTVDESERALGRLMEGGFVFRDRSGVYRRHS
jgi:hypothetical protein